MSTSAEISYYNLFGSSKKREADLLAEKQRWQDELADAYPVTTKTDCATLKDYIAAIDNDMVKVNQDRAAGATNQVGLRWLSVAGDYKNMLANAYNKLDCAEQQAAAETQATLDANLSLLDKAGTVASKQSKTATYVIVGVILAIAVTAGFILKKKFSKK